MTAATAPPAKGTRLIKARLPVLAAPSTGRLRISSINGTRLVDSSGASTLVPWFQVSRRISANVPRLPNRRFRSSRSPHLFGHFHICFSAQSRSRRFLRSGPQAAQVGSRFVIGRCIGPFNSPCYSDPRPPLFAAARPAPYDDLYVPVQRVEEAHESFQREAV